MPPDSAAMQIQHFQDQVRQRLLETTKQRVTNPDRFQAESDFDDQFSHPIFNKQLCSLDQSLQNKVLLLQNAIEEQSQTLKALNEELLAVDEICGDGGHDQADVDRQASVFRGKADQIDQ